MRKVIQVIIILYLALNLNAEVKFELFEKKNSHALFAMHKDNFSEFTIIPHSTNIEINAQIGKDLSILTFRIKSKGMKEYLRIDAGIATSFLVKLSTKPVLLFPVYNFDALLEVPIYIFWKNFTTKFFFRHQSAHFVDGKFNDNINIINFSREDIGIRVIYTFFYFMVYTQFNYYVNRHQNIRPFELHNGFEITSPLVFKYIQGVFDMNITFTIQNNTTTEISIRPGIRFKGKYSILNIMFDYYYGYESFGQIYDTHVNQIGISLTFDF